MRLDTRTARFGSALGFLVITIGCGTEPVTPNDLAIDVAQFAKAPSGTPVTVTITPTSPGLAPAPDNVFSVTIPNGGSLEVRPACSGTDRLSLTGMGSAFDALGTRPGCNGGSLAGFMFLKPLVNLSSAVDAACNDQDAPAQTSNSWNFGVTSRYFFQVDGPDADSKFDDAQYTLVLTDCHVHAVPGQPTWRRVTATTGDLYAGQTGTPMVGFTGIAVNVDLTFRP